MKKLQIIFFCLFIYCLSANGQTWNDVGNGVNGVGWGVAAIHPFNNKLFVGGAFTAAGTIQANRIASWDGVSQWDSLNSGTDGVVSTICDYNGDIYIGGQFTDVDGVPNTKIIAKWNGSSWLSIYTSILAAMEVNAMCVYNGELYVGGKFTNINGTPVSRIAKYNGSTWSDVGGGISGSLPTVYAMAVYNNELYVGGLFYQAGTVPASYIARWNGVQWDSVGGGFDYIVKALVVDSLTNSLYAGGVFETALPNTSCNYVAKWDGNSWSALGNNTGNNFFLRGGVESLGMYHGELYVGAVGFTATSNDTVLARWDRVQWHKLNGPDGTVEAITTWNDTLYIGGYINYCLSTQVNHIAGYYAPPILDLGIHTMVNENLNFIIYPNPTNTELTIETPEDKNYIARVFNSVGQEKEEQKFKKQLKINISNLPKGNYQIQVCEEDGKNCHSKMVVVE